MRVIYLDVLFVINFYVTYLLLCACCAFLHIRPGRLRTLAGALIGGLCSAAVFLPDLGIILNFLLKAAVCAGITFTTFGFMNAKCFLKHYLSFFLMNVVFSGVTVAAGMLFLPALVTNNGFAYMDISVGTLLLSTAAAYFAVKLIRRTLDRRKAFTKDYSVRIIKDGEEVLLKGFADSGNTVCDVFCGRPVIICDRDKLGGIIPAGAAENADAVYIKGVRIIPYATIAGSGLIYAVKPEFVSIESCDGRKSVDAYVGFVAGNGQKCDYDAVFNPGLLI